jgi:hypothetical protein
LADRDNSDSWREAFQAAVIETDLKKVPLRVEAAESAIFIQLQRLSAGLKDQDEHEAIEDALRMLRIIKREKFHYPDSEGHWF